MAGHIIPGDDVSRRIETIRSWWFRAQVVLVEIDARVPISDDVVPDLFLVLRLGGGT